MFRILKNLINTGKVISNKRTFLSQAYYCRELWEQRLQDPLIQKVHLDELYNELDQRYNRTKNISAVDVDVFVHAVNDETYVDEVLDLLHKLRLSADSHNTLSSTSHAVIRNLSNFEKTPQLLAALDDRLNYGLFLDDYTANLLLDKFWKTKDFTSGARIASQLMLQEDFEHPISINLSMLLCYKYLLNPTEWPQPDKPEEPEEEIKVRVSYLRNPYDDEHFDLKDPFKIVGKTLMFITRSQSDALHKSFHLLGLALFKPELAKDYIQKLHLTKEVIYEDVLKLLPKDNPVIPDLINLNQTKIDLEKILVDNVKRAVNESSERDIHTQCRVYSQWEDERKDALTKQMERLQRIQRLANVEKAHKELKDKEMLLWFFENEEKIELEIENRKLQDSEQEENVKQTKKSKVDENYIPPEIQKHYGN